ncbi:MAG: hypothetical protein LUH43_08030 [Clostridia bacterium]|nr:hypothetical protein [Clostridia bacterium]
MKKFICILVCFAAFLTVSSCSSSSGLVAFEIGGSSDDSDPGSHSSEYALWSDENYLQHEDSTAPETYTITFNGVELTGTYLYSRTGYGDLFQRNYYQIEASDGYLGGYFTIRTDTNEVVDFVRGHEYPENYDDDVRGEYSFEQCKASAEALVSQYIHIEDYELETEEEGALDHFVYTYCVDGIETKDRVSILVSTYTGEVTLFSAGDLGAFSENSEVTATSTVNTSDAAEVLTSDEAEEILEAKVNAIYSDYDSYEIYYQVLIKLPDGSIGMLNTVTVKYSTELDTGETAYNGYQIMILLCNSSSVTE